MHSTKIILITAITVLAGAFSALAAPVNFNEVSLWVRAKETDKSIVTEVSQRKLSKALTPAQESTLKSQGASDSLVQSLRNSALVASTTDVAAAETKAPAFAGRHVCCGVNSGNTRVGQSVSVLRASRRRDLTAHRPTDTVCLKTSQ